MSKESYSEEKQKEIDIEAKDVVGAEGDIVLRNGWAIVGKIIMLVVDSVTGALTYLVRNHATGAIDKVPVDDVDYVETDEDPRNQE